MDTQQTVKILNDAKKAKGWTLKKLAEESGLSQGTVNKIMCGESRGIKLDKLQKLAAALEIPPQCLSDMLCEKQESDSSTYARNDGFEKDSSNALGMTGFYKGSAPFRSAGDRAYARDDKKENFATALADSRENWYGLAKVACVSPEVRLADCQFNASRIAEGAKKAAAEGAKIVVFPELCITGYSCGDLFFQQRLRDSALAALDELRKKSQNLSAVVAVGLPICDDGGRLFNAAAILFGGEILGIVPKANLPTYNEFFEKRIFTPAPAENSEIHIFGKAVPFGKNLIFADIAHPEIKIAVEICEDIWVANSPSLSHTADGATIILNLSASDEAVCKADYRRKMVEIQSGKTCCIYAYCSCGYSDSSSAATFSAHNIICENSQILAESAPFAEGYAVAECDFEFICNERAKMQHENAPMQHRTVFFDMPCGNAPTRIYDAMPFVPTDAAERDNRCETILQIQSHALAHRIKHIGASCVVLGVSGGSDSTLALLVCKKAMDLLGRSAKDIVAVTMPCFGTTQRTLNNSVALAKELNTTVKKIDISASVTQHLKNISHSGSPDTTYENAQARERTQVLMDIANSRNGLVVGTGDLSENALGWCTFNGDQMSMYAVNATVPKTAVRAMIAYEAARADKKIAAVLNDILDTPVSPELLPPTDGDISQVTEDIVGPYELHDYFLYMMIRKGFAPSKIFTLAKLSFEGTFTPREIYKWLEMFVKRFFSQQFKRNCAPDGMRVGSVDLTKYSWRMPSDACRDEWLKDLEKVKE